MSLCELNVPIEQWLPLDSHPRNWDVHVAFVILQHEGKCTIIPG